MKTLRDAMQMRLYSRWGRVVACCALMALSPVHAQSPLDVPTRPGSASTDPEGGELRLKFNTAPVDMVLQEYADKTGRTLLLAPSLPAANITLRSHGSLTRDEFLEAIETVLGMNGIALLPEGEKFLRVVPSKQAREEPMPILSGAVEEDRPDRSKVISQMISLSHIEAAEAQKYIQPLLHPYAQVHLFEGINNILITDTAANVNRVMQVISMIDQPVEAREEPIIVQIRFAKASDIKGKLEEIIAEQQKEQKSTVQRPRDAGAPGVVDAAANPPAATPPGVIRAARRIAVGVLEDLAEVERGLIRGGVKIIADDRTNVLILIMRKENLAFFEKIIQVLDVETSPDVMVRVFRLEFAESESIATMLNDLIGATSTATDQAAAPLVRDGDVEYGAGAALRDFVEQRRAAAPVVAPVAAAIVANRISKVGQLSKEDIKILSDERTNSLIIMASRSDIAALEEIIRNMDIMLSQVLVEAVIVEVNLDDSIQTGVDWVQRALVSYDESGPAGTYSPKVAYAGGAGGGNAAPVDPTVLTTPESFAGLAGAGLSYYLTLFDLNVDMVIKAVASDSRTRILSSPVILTTDNKKASIEVSQATYFFKGQRPVQTGSSIEYTEDVEREDVGIQLTVTPRINEKRFVVMEIEQAVEDITGSQRIGTTDWPIVTSRKVTAEVAVRSGDTIVLGGLVKNTDSSSKSGVPFLADIPILGIPFRSKSKSKRRQEVIVFITPYVMNTPEEIVTDAVRRQDSMGADGMWQRGWSNSRLAEPRLVGQVQDLGSERGELGYATNKPVRMSTEGAQPFRGHTDSLLKPSAGQPEAPVPPSDDEVDPAQGGAAWDPMDALDPELRKFVEEEDKKWSRSVKRADRRVNSGAGGN
ncbi:MAG: type II secretion system secretin GspD [Verrucomicrobia bacterium]|nr:type II secretion system secretin GspD [Verrucomicrobiota bacterium]